jgi:hypothetical protein
MSLYSEDGISQNQSTPIYYELVADIFLLLELKKGSTGTTVGQFAARKAAKRDNYANKRKGVKNHVKWRRVFENLPKDPSSTINKNPNFSEDLVKPRSLLNAIIKEPHS